MLSPQYHNALTWATHLHAQQQRKINHTPYIAHLLSVSSLVLEHGGSEQQAIAALLHDAVEDQGVALEEIQDRFGPTVASYVADLSEPTTHPPVPWRQRKEQYLRQLQAASPDVALISLADKLHNARSLACGLYQYGDPLWDLFFGSRCQDNQWFYRSLVQIFREKGYANHWLLLQLQQSLNQIFPEFQNDTASPRELSVTSCSGSLATR